MSADSSRRVAGAPSLERIAVPAGSPRAGCQLLRITTATKTATLPAPLRIGFHTADRPACCELIRTHRIELDRFSSVK